MPGKYDRQDLQEIRAKISFVYDELVKLDRPGGLFFSGSDPNSYVSLAKDGLKVAMAAIDRQLAK